MQFFPCLIPLPEAVLLFYDSHMNIIIIKKAGGVLTAQLLGLDPPLTIGYAYPSHQPL
jgi:hypothetical protein